MADLPISVWNETTGRYICRRGKKARMIASRLLGLLGKREFGPSDGLLLQPSSAIHTVGMAFGIDVLALDRAGRVIGMRQNLRPQRAAFFDLRTRSILELPEGQIRNGSIRLGDRMVVCDATA